MPAVPAPAGPAPLHQIQSYFAPLPDPRVERTKHHLLGDILVLTLLAVLCGADDWVAVAEFGRAKQAFFARFLALPHGIPAHDTFGRLFARLDPDPFQACFRAWVADLVAQSAGQIIGIDGKLLHGSADRAAGHGAIDMVSAWASANGAGLVLAQVKVAGKSNEITAIPLLLRLLDLSECIVTIDAMGCQREIAAAIVAAEADYVLALKGNQEGTHADTVQVCAGELAAGFRGGAHVHTTTLEKGHGRVEEREYWLLTDPRYLEYVNRAGKWVGLQGLGLVEATRTVDGVVSRERRYYFCSVRSVGEFARAVRGHWGIENGLHWVLDIAFREDGCRARKDHSAQNFAIVRHLALNLLKQERTAKCGVKNKRLRAGWDEGYLRKVLEGTAAPA